MTDTVTLKGMCEEIAALNLLRKPDGTALTPEEVFNYGPTGELYMVFEWYELVLAVKCAKSNLRNTLLGMLKEHPDAGLEAKIREMVP